MPSKTRFKVGDSVEVDYFGAKEVAEVLEVTLELFGDVKYKVRVLKYDMVSTYYEDKLLPVPKVNAVFKKLEMSEKAISKLNGSLVQHIENGKSFDRSALFATIGPNGEELLNGTQVNPSQKTLVFKSNMPQEQVAPDHVRRALYREEGVYWGILLDSELKPIPDKREVLVGVLQFVILASRPDLIIVGNAHHHLANGGHVRFAGELHLDGSGKLEQWTNQTGHYRTHPGFFYVAASVPNNEVNDKKPLLPPNLFVRFSQR